MTVTVAVGAHPLRGSRSCAWTAHGLGPAAQAMCWGIAHVPTIADRPFRPSRSIASDATPGLS